MILQNQQISVSYSSNELNKILYSCLFISQGVLQDCGYVWCIVEEYYIILYMFVQQLNIAFNISRPASNYPIINAWLWRNLHYQFDLCLLYITHSISYKAQKRKICTSLGTIGGVFLFSGVMFLIKCEHLLQIKLMKYEFDDEYGWVSNFNLFISALSDWCSLVLLSLLSGFKCEFIN